MRFFSIARQRANDEFLELAKRYCAQVWPRWIPSIVVAFTERVIGRYLVDA